ncbi:MAG: hypothetical protein M3Y56_02135 [Armatimonadota bacterium]|nr:hypothetical protein [Armatimonadota bacterium]
MDQQGPGTSYSQPPYEAPPATLGQTQYQPGNYGTAPGMGYPGSQSSNIDTLGILWIIWGSISLLFGLGYGALMGFAGLATSAASVKPDDAAAGGLIAIVGIVIAVISAVCGVPCIMAGIGLRRRVGWGRILTFVMSVINVFSLPFGTALAIYSFIVLVKPEAEAEFH